jgi:hypothetical protein
MKQKIAGAVVVLTALGFFLWYAHSRPASPSGLGTSTAPSALSGSSSPASSLIKATPGIETWYTNKKLHFSFRIPDGFTAPDIKTGSPNVQGVLVENAAGDELIVAVFPLANGPTGPLTVDGIRENAPGQIITNVTQGVIGAVVTGLSFDTDAQAWGGDGVGFWFAYNGYLYELTAYKKDQELLDFVRSTWQFSPPVPPPKG